MTACVRRAARELPGEVLDCYAGLSPAGEVSAHRLIPRAPRQEHLARPRTGGLRPCGSAARRRRPRLALRNARVIVRCYALQDHPDDPSDPHSMDYDEGAFAENAAWWYRHTGHKVLFWSSRTHTSKGRSLGGVAPALHGR
ncbi:hypothetical protein [Streptomyces sp. NPDC002057]|uniref:hypothetical protein n=1 Tax=Streptomyces sp. NPDC002057 TaxID=3154664 RepID=UPI0033237A4D